MISTNRAGQPWVKPGNDIYLLGRRNRPESRFASRAELLTFTRFAGQRRMS